MEYLGRGGIGKWIVYLILAPVFLLISLIFYYIYLAKPPPLPVLDPDAWWGPEALREKQDISIRPFKLEFKDDMIQDLRRRLRNTRPLTPPLEDIGFQYGFNTKELRKWLEYWAESYNFTAREIYMNRYPQYKTNIQGLDIYFVRVKPEIPPGKEIQPILILHGWPGSTREFHEAIPHLTAAADDRDFVLEVIVPSLPGFGYSDDILGFHTNLPITFSPKAPLVLTIFAYFKSLLVDQDVADRVYPLSKTLSFVIEESGYFHILATKPDTVGIAMADSPAGLAAFILEKFSAGTNPAYRGLPSGGIESHFTKDQLLDNLMMYWAPNCFTGTGRLYAESFTAEALKSQIYMDDVPTTVPTWALQVKHEILYYPPAVLRLKYKNLMGVTTFQNGGHFIALELPMEFSKDVLNAIKEFQKFWKDVKKS